MIRLGLQRVRRALVLLGHPEEAFASVIVAGTNGKGSVSALIESAARAAGIKTGLYTSPHLVDVRERVRVSGKKIGPSDWKSLLRRVERLPVPLTEFERQTLLAFLHFARRKVGLAVMEVGLGGRLDAVNALPAPEVCVITSIGHDHRDWLGPTLRHIYVEKRGVSRPGTPLVQSVPRALRPAGDEYFQERGVPSWTLDREILVVPRGVDWKRRVQRLDVRMPGAHISGLETPLLGDHQRRNAALAAAACHLLKRRGWPLTEEAIRAGFAEASWPGRFHVVSGRPDAILDGAHNREAAEVLAAAYRVSPWGRRLATVVFGCLKDKDAAAMSRALKPLARRVLLTPLPTPRSRTAAELSPLWKGLPREAFPTAAAAVRRARSWDDPILVTGSLYLVGEAMKVFRRSVR